MPNTYKDASGATVNVAASAGSTGGVAEEVETVELAVVEAGVTNRITRGSQLSATSLPVVVASDQAAIAAKMAAAAQADGHSATLGTQADAAWAGSGSGTVVAVLKAIWSRLLAKGQQVMANSLPVTVASDQSAVPVSAASLPLPTGASADGTDATGVVQLTGGAGIRGWLSGIFSKLSNALTVILTPATSGGLSVFKNASVVNTPLSVKNGAGQLYSYYLYNSATSARFVKLWDKATTPVVGTDAPFATLALPAGAAANLAIPHGLPFANQLWTAATAGQADTDNTAPSASDVLVNLFYK